MSGASSVDPLPIPTPPSWRGFSFALHPTRCRAFILPCYNTATYKRLRRVLRRQCSYTTKAIKQRTGLCRRFSGDLPYFDAVVWMVHQAMLHLLRNAGAYHSAAAPPARTRYQRHAQTLYSSAQPHTMPARRGGSCRLRIAGKCYTRRTC